MKCTLLKSFFFLLLLIGSVARGLLSLDDLDEETLANLRSYHGITSVLQTEEQADGYYGYGYNGFANFYMVADQRDHTNPDTTLWYATSRFMQSDDRIFTTKLTNVFDSQVRINVNYDPGTYRSVYGIDTKRGIGRSLRNAVTERTFFNLDNSLGSNKEGQYRSPSRVLFMWKMDDRAQEDLPANAAIAPLQDNEREFTHTTLQDFVAKILTLRTAERIFPYYSLTGVSYRYDALNCVSFGLRVLNRLGLDIGGHQQLARYLRYEDKGWWSYYVWDRVPTVYPEWVLKELFKHFVGSTPKAVLSQVLMGQNPTFGPFVGELEKTKINFPDSFE